MIQGLQEYIEGDGSGMSGAEKLTKLSFLLIRSSNLNKYRVSREINYRLLHTPESSTRVYIAKSVPAGCLAVELI